MGADDSAPVTPVDAPELRPIDIPARLADKPADGPKYAVTIQNRAGESVAVADPNATRAAVALMNVHAVVGGAACHWGGPAAFRAALEQPWGGLRAALELPWDGLRAALERP